MTALAILLFVVGLVGMAWMVIEAFSEDTTQGVLCLLLFPYAVYFLLAHVEAPKKWIILGLLACGIAGRILLFALD